MCFENMSRIDLQLRQEKTKQSKKTHQKNKQTKNHLERFPKAGQKLRCLNMQCHQNKVTLVLWLFFQVTNQVMFCFTFFFFLPVVNFHPFIFVGQIIKFNMSTKQTVLRHRLNLCLNRVH